MSVGQCASFISSVGGCGDYCHRSNRKKATLKHERGKREPFRMHVGDGTQSYTLLCPGESITAQLLIEQ